MAGHVFVTCSDITKLRCDAWLLPTDQSLWVTEGWISQAPNRRIEELENRDFRSRWHELKGIPTVCKPWRRASGDSPAPIPVLVDVGGTLVTAVSWYRERIRDFVETALDAVRQRTSNWRIKPLLAVPLVGTGQGGQFQRKGEMARAILSELSTLVSLQDFDAVLVVADEAALAAAQANREPSTTVAISEPIRQQVERLAEHARNGNLVLFLGAGISQQAGLPTWSELLRQLSLEAGMSDVEQEALSRLTWLDAASVLEARLRARGRVFGEAVAEATRSECFSLGHALAAGLPVRESVTTNYDDLFETAVKASGSALAILPYEPSSSADRWLLKLHGSVDQPLDIVLTRADFMRYENNRAALYGIVQAMLMTRHILFIGFSLTDDNFHRLADEVRLALEGRNRDSQPDRRARFGTALVPHRDELFQSLWTNDLNLLMAGTKDSSKSEVARDVELILDYLSYRSSSVSAHLLDDTFEGALDAGQLRIKVELRRLLSALRAEDLESPTFAPFAQLLANHGNQVRTSATEITI